MSFFKDLKFLSYRPFTCLDRVTPKNFKLFVTTIKGNVSLISLSVHLSFVYRRATSVFELTLYPITLFPRVELLGLEVD